MSWQPDPTALQELVTVLRDSTSPDSEVQRRMAEVGLCVVAPWNESFLTFALI